MKNFKIYSFLLLAAFFVPNVAAATKEMSPEAKEFKLLVKEALKAEKPSAGQKALIGVLREAIKVGGCIGLFKLADYTSDKYGVRSVATDFGNSAKRGAKAAFRAVTDAVGASTPKFLQGSSPEVMSKSMRSQILPPILIVLAVLLPIICDSSIYKQDNSVAALQKLKKYIVSLNPAQKREVAKLFNGEYESLLEQKLSKESDGSGVKALSLVTILVDLLLPLAIPLIFAYNNGFSLDKMTDSLRDKAKQKRLTDEVSESDFWLPAWDSNPTENIYVLTACAAVFVLNIPVILSRLSSSSDGEKAKILARIREELN